ncbi:MAG: sugar transferase [Janthinobacterium lividum]
MKLVGRSFTTGTVIKLYSYDLPAGSRSVISRDLNQSLNEFLFEPALPVLTVDTKERYPDDKNLERALFGLKRRLEQDDKDYVEVNFVEDYTDALFGKMRVAGYVFHTKVGGKSAKETKDSIQREFFKNNMVVLFSMNGQVHGSYSSEFITRAMKLNLLKNHLLLHIDCTNMSYNFRKELFMASRDRLKDSHETRELRKFLASKLGKAGGRLAEIEKKRKDAIAVDGSDSKDLLKNVTKNIQMNPELLKLLGSTFKLEEKKAQPEKHDKPEKKALSKPAPEPFKPQRFPSFLRVRGNHDGDKAITGIPLGGEKTVRFDTDVENQYFNRIEEPGELKIALLSVKRPAGKNNNGSSGGNSGSLDVTALAVEDVLNVNVSSPQDGTIRVTINPQKDAQVGDAVQLKVSLTARVKADIHYLENWSLWLDCKIILSTLKQVVVSSEKAY